MGGEHHVLSSENDVSDVVTAAEKHSVLGRHGRSFHVKKDFPVMQRCLKIHLLNLDKCSRFRVLLA